MRTFCFPVGKPASRNTPLESLTANLRAAGTATITPTSGLPLNAEIARPLRAAELSAWDHAVAGRVAAAMTAAVRLSERAMRAPTRSPMMLPHSARPDLHQPAGPPGEPARA